VRGEFEDYAIHGELQIFHAAKSPGLRTFCQMRSSPWKTLANLLQEKRK
jgi:hypothetical protein